jgi:hypothetical protein
LYSNRREDRCGRYVLPSHTAFLDLCTAWNFRRRGRLHWPRFPAPIIANFGFCISVIIYSPFFRYFGYISDPLFLLSWILLVCYTIIEADHPFCNVGEFNRIGLCGHAFHYATLFRYSMNQIHLCPRQVCLRRCCARHIIGDYIRGAKQSLLRALAELVLRYRRNFCFSITCRKPQVFEGVAEPMGVCGAQRTPSASEPTGSIEPSISSGDLLALDSAHIVKLQFSTFVET